MKLEFDGHIKTGIFSMVDRVPQAQTSELSAAESPAAAATTPAPAEGTFPHLRGEKCADRGGTAR